MNTTNETTEMLRRRIALQEQEVKDEYWLDVSTAELRAILDAYAALRDERDALRTRLAAAEKVVNAVQEWEMYQDIEYSEALVEQMLRYKKRFGGRDD